MGYFTNVIRDAKPRGSLPDIQFDGQYSSSSRLLLPGSDDSTNVHSSQTNVDSGEHSFSSKSMLETTMPMEHSQDEQNMDSGYSGEKRPSSVFDTALSNAHGASPRAVSPAEHGDEYMGPTVGQTEIQHQSGFDAFADTDGPERDTFLSSSLGDADTLNPLHILSADANEDDFLSELNEEPHTDILLKKDSRLHAPELQKTQGKNVFSKDTQSIHQQNTSIETLPATNEDIFASEVHERMLDGVAIDQASSRDIQDVHQRIGQTDSSQFSHGHQHDTDHLDVLIPEARKPEEPDIMERVQDVNSSDVDGKQHADRRVMQNDDSAALGPTIGKTLTEHAHAKSQLVRGNAPTTSVSSAEKQAAHPIQARPADKREAPPNAKEPVPKLAKPLVSPPHPTSETARGNATIHLDVSDEQQVINPAHVLPANKMDTSPRGKILASKAAKPLASPSHPTSQIVRGYTSSYPGSGTEKQLVNPSRVLPTDRREAHPNNKNRASRHRESDSAQAAPEVRIGQVDVFIDAPKARKENKVREAASSAPGPRHYLRNI